MPTDLACAPRIAGEDDDSEEPPWDLFSALVYILATGMTSLRATPGPADWPASARGEPSATADWISLRASASLPVAKPAALAG